MPVLSKKQEQKIDQYFFAVAAGSDPCGWRKPIQSVWIKYKGSQAAEAMYRYYVFRENWKTTCREMHISYNSLYRWRMDFLLSAALAGLKAGLDI